MGRHLIPRAVWVGLACTMIGCGDPEIVVPEVLAVDLYPPHGSVEIAVNVQGLVYFSHEVADPEVANQGISLECVGTPSPSCATPIDTPCATAPVSAAVAFEPGAMEARITLGQDLESNLCYVYRVNGGIEAKDKNVGPLPNDRRAVFQTAL